MTERQIIIRWSEVVRQSTLRECHHWLTDGGWGEDQGRWTVDCWLVDELQVCRMMAAAGRWSVRYAGMQVFLKTKLPYMFQVTENWAFVKTASVKIFRNCFHSLCVVGTPGGLWLVSFIWQTSDWPLWRYSGRLYRHLLLIVHLTSPGRGLGQKHTKTESQPGTRWRGNTEKHEEEVRMSSDQIRAQ